MNKEITPETVAKALPECTAPETLHELLRLYTTGCKVNANHRQRLLIEAAHKYIGLGSLNKSCGSCMGTAMTKVYDYISKYLPATTYVKKAKVTRKKVVKKAKVESTEVDPSKMKWAELKAYAKKQGVTVHKRTKAEILKDLSK